ncbi:Uncharacterised protein [BD1-7 clade bacterium]|uniref:Thioesterase domain-containing protein n=1 Tax=BD1-7 clade bacterium TaxID=2029982 RepID=A0A5S9PP14_9GAMM|nr:Uncharacterised protein [BD1-7 clade bacterium]
MSKWKQALDAAVSGAVQAHLMPPHIQYLSLPPISSWKDNTITIDWQATEDIYQGGGMVFGGYLSALADYAAGTAMLTCIEDDQQFATRNLEMTFKRPVKAGLVTIIAEVRPSDAQEFDVEVQFLNADNNLCAVCHVRQTLISLTRDIA